MMRCIRFTLHYIKQISLRREVSHIPGVGYTSFQIVSIDIKTHKIKDLNVMLSMFCLFIFNGLGLVGRVGLNVYLATQPIFLLHCIYGRK